MTDAVDVAVVGAGPAGATVGALLAAQGHSVVVLERRPAYGWHACGVFAGPAVRPLLGRAGVTAEGLAAMARTIPAMRVETAAGATIRLTYGADRGGEPALGFDRRRLDEALVAVAAARGATICRGTTVVSLRLDGPVQTIETRTADGRTERLRAHLVVGADGIRSVVAGAAGVSRPPRLTRVGLTFHVDEADDSASRETANLPVDARMVVLGDAYCGLAPVPGRRVNVGIVLRGPGMGVLRARGADDAWREIREALPAPSAGAVRLADPSPAIERPAGASPLGHRVTRRGGRGWLLVGDAAGFLDPFTGEGLHRALSSAFLAADAIERHLRGERDAIAAYDRAMRGRFAAKDAVSLLVQAFLARPALFEYAARRLARREDPRRTLELVLGDLAPASRAFDPRFLAGLLAP